MITAHLFTSVCNVLREDVIAGLVKENRELKLKLFWERHMLPKLVNKIKIANASLEYLRCNCCDCSSAGRTDAMGDSEFEGTIFRECRFVPWFETKLELCGMTSMQISHPTGFHVSNQDGNVSDADCHIGWMNGYNGPKHSLTYGQRLTEAKSVDDPEIKKLAILFKHLNFYTVEEYLDWLYLEPDMCREVRFSKGVYDD